MKMTSVQQTILLILVVCWCSFELCSAFRGTCTGVPAIANVKRAKVVITTPRIVLDVTCDDGYRLTGAQYVCDETIYIWKGSQLCERIVNFCPASFTVARGVAHVTKRSLGDVAFITCDEGTRLVSKDAFVCLKRSQTIGDWHGTDVCQTEYVSKNQMQYFLPPYPLTFTLDHAEAQQACNRVHARLRNVWDTTFNIHDFNKHYGLADSPESFAFNLEPTNFGIIGHGVIVCERTDYSCNSAPGHYYFLARDSKQQFVKASSGIEAQTKCSARGGKYKNADPMDNKCIPGFKRYLSEDGLTSSQIEDATSNLDYSRGITWRSRGYVVCQRPRISVQTTYSFVLAPNTLALGNRTFTEQEAFTVCDAHGLALTTTTSRVKTDKLNPFATAVGTEFGQPWSRVSTQSPTARRNTVICEVPPADILCGAPTAFFFAASSIGQYDSILMTPSSVRASRACADQGGQLPLQLLVKPQCLTKLNRFLTTHHPGVRRLSYSRSWFDNHGPQMRPAGESEPVLCQRYIMNCAGVGLAAAVPENFALARAVTYYQAKDMCARQGMVLANSASPWVNGCTGRYGKYLQTLVLGLKVFSNSDPAYYAERFAKRGVLCAYLNWAF